MSCFYIFILYIHFTAYILRRAPVWPACKALFLLKKIYTIFDLNPITFLHPSHFKLLKYRVYMLYNKRNSIQ